MWYLGYCRTGCIVWAVLVLPFGRGVTSPQENWDFGVSENYASFSYPTESDLVLTFYKNLLCTSLTWLVCGRNPFFPYLINAAVALKGCGKRRDEAMLRQSFMHLGFVILCVSGWAAGECAADQLESQQTDLPAWAWRSGTRKLGHSALCWFWLG